MLSPADLLIIGAAALLFFGPDQLPKVARQAGRVVRDVQATSQSFVREMERAADESEAKHRRDDVVPWHPIEVERVNDPPPASTVAADRPMEDGGVENSVAPESAKRAAFRMTSSPAPTPAGATESPATTLPDAADHTAPPPGVASHPEEGVPKG